MSAVERLQAAIERLERLKARSAPGWWEVDTNAPFSLDLVGIFSEGGSGYAVLFDRDAQPRRETAHLIVTLHRTIDVQLAILREALENVEETEDGAIRASALGMSAIGLAEAILGDQS